MQQEDLHKANLSQVVYRGGSIGNGLQPIGKPAKLSSSMLRKEVNNRMNVTLNPTKHFNLGKSNMVNPYDNIATGKPKQMPATVMNSREKLNVVQPQPPVTAQD